VVPLAGCYGTRKLPRLSQKEILSHRFLDEKQQEGKALDRGWRVQNLCSQYIKHAFLTQPYPGPGGSSRPAERPPMEPGAMTLEQAIEYALNQKTD